MAVSLETVQDLFNNKQWAACAENAAQALAEGEKEKDKRAALNLYRSISLRRLKQFNDAVEPGWSALHLGEELEDADLIGRALLNLGWILHKIPSMEPTAVRMQQRFLAQSSRFPTLRDEYLGAMLNLGVYLRAAGEYEEAYKQFRATFETARQRGAQEIAQLGRTYAVWEALRLRRLSEAEALIQLGEQQKLGTPRLRATHLIDLAELSMIKNDPNSAIGYILAAAPQIEQVQEEDPHLLPNALEILQRAAAQLDDPALSLVLGVLVKESAELDDRHDFVALATEIIDNVSFQHPDAVHRAMRSLDAEMIPREEGKS